MDKGSILVQHVKSIIKNETNNGFLVEVYGNLENAKNGFEIVVSSRDQFLYKIEFDESNYSTIHKTEFSGFAVAKELNSYIENNCKDV